MSAVDADVIKTYVELGLGVGIVASMVYEPARDSALALLDGSHLFGEHRAHRRPSRPLSAGLRLPLYRIVRPSP